MKQENSESLLKIDEQQQLMYCQSPGGNNPSVSNFVPVVIGVTQDAYGNELGYAFCFQNLCKGKKTFMHFRYKIWNNDDLV